MRYTRGMSSVFIAIGSNVNPENHIKAAVTMLRMHHPTVRFSSVYRSAPLHHAAQDEYLNAVAHLEADLDAHAIHELLIGIEKSLSKKTLFRFGPRNIDLDLLLHGSEILPDSAGWRAAHASEDMTASLILPHPRMHERRFVLEPLTELLEPTATHPIIGKTWKDLLAETMHQEVFRLPIQL